jgi:phosphosulfolactate synthase (CoM biosynthesis protein A)
MALLFGVLAVALVAGCGGSSDSSSSSSSDSGSSLSKAEFIEQGDEICTKGDQAIEAEANEFAKENGIDTEKPTKAQQEEVIAQVVAPAVKQQGEEIGDLGPPSGDEEQVEAIVEAVGRGADELEKDPGGLLEGKNPLKEGSKLARAYGFKSCGEE